MQCTWGRPRKDNTAYSDDDDHRHVSGEVYRRADNVELSRTGWCIFIISVLFTQFCVLEEGPGLFQCVCEAGGVLVVAAAVVVAMAWTCGDFPEGSRAFFVLDDFHSVDAGVSL